MKVRAIRKHGNVHPPRWVKYPGRKYEVDDREGERLIALGLVARDCESESGGESRA